MESDLGNRQPELGQQDECPRPGRKTNRTRASQRPALAEEITVAEFKKNRGGETVRVMLRPYEGHNLVDIRTWFSSDGRRKPGKGFACSVRRLLELAGAIDKAVCTARDLGLIDPVEVS